MSCEPSEFLSLRQIAAEYRGAGTLATWRCRLRRNTGGLQEITRKIGGSRRIERRDLERYLGSATTGKAQEPSSQDLTANATAVTGGWEEQLRNQVDELKLAEARHQAS